MLDVQREIAIYRAEFEALVARWNALSAEARRASWSRYTVLLDEGAAGCHPFARLLINAWCEGWDGSLGLAFDRNGALGPREAPSPA